jgi:hypothetical protein
LPDSPTLPPGNWKIYPALRADRDSQKFSRAPDFRFMFRLPQKPEILDQYYKTGKVKRVAALG